MVKTMSTHTTGSIHKSFSHMSESSDKITDHLVDAARKAKVLAASSGKQVGTVKTVMKSGMGIVMYVNVQPFIANAGTETINGLSIEIPLYNFLKEGQVRICPSLDGWYEVELSSGQKIEAWYGAVKTQWSIGPKIVGEMHEIFLEDWPFPAIVVGIKKIGDIDPNLENLANRVEEIIKDGLEKASEFKEAVVQDPLGE
jgi:hypothetical protein